MSRMKCTCGNVMTNVVSPCPTEGTVTGQQDYDFVCEEFTNVVGSFLEAVRAGQRDEWMGDNGFSFPYPTDLPDEEVIYDLLLRCFGNRTLSIAECEECGRLWVQKAPDVNEYWAYSSDAGGYAGVLKTRS